MWTTSYTEATSATPEAVWSALEALHSGTPLGPNSDEFELHGPFAVGTTLTITPQGQEAMSSTIVALEPCSVYADQTVFGDLILTVRHDLAPAVSPATGTVVTHTLTIEGPTADDIGPDLGPQISGDFPSAMSELIAAAERGTARTS